ncbi:MAG: amino acid decarboxylase [Saprospiraceae bacterium]|nr:amino acid decarboxylase [Saprospiraceae bacterium]
MLDDMIHYLKDIRHRPVWSEIPESAKYHLKQEIPQHGQSLENVYSEFKEHILPYTKGNIHPRFWAWVQGTGIPTAMLADMLASAMNPNVTIGEHAPMYADIQVVNWCKELMHFPPSASGLLVSGASMANLTALIVARNKKLKNVRQQGLHQYAAQPVMYCSTESHSCIQKAAEIIGIGAENIRRIKVKSDYKIDIVALHIQIEADLSAGYEPFCIVANIGTVNTGAIDSLDDLIKIARQFDLWLHADGAFGALAILVPEYFDQLSSLSEVDSVAFDLHKWMYMPYEAGCVLIKDADAHRESFAITPNYLSHHSKGLAAGPESYNNYGIELSRGFKALKIWMCIKEQGIVRFGKMIEQNILQARYLEKVVIENEYLEILAPVSLNIVCYRFVVPGMSNDSLNSINKNICMELQTQGIASPSSTILHNIYAIRVAITNHRSKLEDFKVLVDATIRLGLNLIQNRNN